MNSLRQHVPLWMAVTLTAVLAGCGGGSGGSNGGSNNNPPPIATYVLTVNTTNPTTGVTMTVAPADNNGAANGNASFSRTYNAATSVTITAPAAAGSHTFSSWTGCATATTVTCKVTMNANTTIAASYTSPVITVTPNAAIIGTQVQFNAALPAGVTGNVTWSVATPSGSGLSAGTISTTGLYSTPYPAPSTVTVTATSAQDTTVIGSATVALSQPAASNGPALSIDVGTITHPINPFIYGMNAFQLAGTTAKKAGITIDRWGGDATSRYNYKLDVTSSASDWYFENHNGTTGVQDTGAFNAQVQADQAIGAKTIGTVPVNGWVAKDGASCSYPKSTYPNQVAIDPYGGACGNGVYPLGINGCTNSGWWAYFYSKKDIENGWGNGSPCWSPWSNPIDRNAHGGIPLIEYYLQQFAAYEKNHGTRLLDYLDLHTYFAPSNLAFSTGGDTLTQQARLNSTRVFWDPTYTDPNFQQPNYISDSNYTSSCNPPAQAPQVIRMMKKWVADDYPGTKLAITEYNWGGQEHISGALAQADILGIFGREGLDIGTLWGAPDPATQIPGLMAFQVFRNYDGAGATFGDQAITSTSVDQGKLSVYGSLRSKDNVLTIIVINKTYGDLTSTLNLANFSAGGPAQLWLYSAANLNAIAPKSNAAVTGPSGGSTTSTLSTTFPAQSITVLAIPRMQGCQHDQ